MRLAPSTRVDAAKTSTAASTKVLKDLRRRDESISVAAASAWFANAALPADQIAVEFATWRPPSVAGCRMLLRRPYPLDGISVERFCYRESRTVQFGNLLEMRFAFGLNLVELG